MVRNGEKLGKANQCTLAPQYFLFAPTSPHNTPFLPISSQFPPHFTHCRPFLTFFLGTGYITTHFVRVARGVAYMDYHVSLWPPRVRDMGSHNLVWLFELGIWICTFECGRSSWGSGLPYFDVAFQVRDMDSYISVWHVELQTWTPTLWCGLLGCKFGLSHFAVAL